MNYRKLLSITSGIAVLAASTLPMNASALSTASMTLSGNSNGTGNFMATIYENTGADTVTTAYATLDFSSAVSNVSYDYSVGPFVNALPSGAHSTYGDVSGQNAVATVHFTVASPTGVTATVSASSYLKHADRDSNGIATGVTENFIISRGSANFVYNAPVVTTPSAPTKSSTTATSSTPSSSSTTTPTTSSKTSTSSTAIPASTSTTTSTSSSKNSKQTPTAKAKDIKSNHTSFVASTISALAIVAVAVYWLVIRKRVELKPMAAVYKLVGARKHTTTPAKKPASHSKSSTKKTKKF
jgi:hypothetical protein